MHKKDHWVAFNDAKKAFTTESPEAALALMADRREFICNNPKVAMKVARFEIAARCYQDALNTLEASGCNDNTDQLTITLRVTALAGLQRWYDLWQFAKTIPDGLIPENRKTCVRIAKSAIQNGDMQTAIHASRVGLLHRPNDIGLITLLYEGLSTYPDPDTFPEVVEREIFEIGNTPEHLHGLLTALHVGGLPTATFVRLFEKGKDRWPDIERLHDFEPFLPSQALVGIGAADPLAPLKKRLWQLAETNELLRELAQVFEKFDSARLTRPVISWLENSGISISEKGPTDHVIVYFGGLMDNALQDGIFDAYFSAIGASSIFVRDPSRLLRLNGIPSIAPTFDESAAKIREAIDALHPNARVTMVGTSGGGMGALCYGHAVGAQRILCFSALTTMETEFRERINDRRVRTLQHRLNREVPAERLEMRPLFENVGYSGQVDLIYGAEHAIDRAHSENMSGLANVSLYPVAGFENHSTALKSIFCGSFESILNGDMSAVGRMHLAHKPPA